MNSLKIIKFVFFKTYSTNILNPRSLSIYSKVSPSKELKGFRHL